MEESTENHDKAMALTAVINTVPSPTSGSLLPPSGSLPMVALPEDGVLDGSASRVLPRPPVAPAGRSYRRKDSMMLMHSAAQAEELASADATTTKTLDDIEALLASLKSPSLAVSAPSAPSTPKPQDTPAVLSPKVVVKSRFMDYNNAAAEEVGAGPRFRGKVRRHSSCTSFLNSSGATAFDRVEPGSPLSAAEGGGCLSRDSLDSPLLSPRVDPARPAGSLAVVRHSRSSHTSGGDSCAAGAAAMALSGHSFSSRGKPLSPTKPVQQQQQLRQGMGGGMARPPPRRNASCCSLLPSQATTLMSRASSIKATPAVSSGPLQVLGACNNDDGDSDDDGAGMRLSPEASGASFSSSAAAARHGSIFLPGSVGVAAAAVPGRSLSDMKQLSVSFFKNALAGRRASSTNLGELLLPQRALSMVQLPSIGISKYAAQPCTNCTPR